MSLLDPYGQHHGSNTSPSMIHMIDPSAACCKWLIQPDEASAGSYLMLLACIKHLLDVLCYGENASGIAYLIQLLLDPA